MTPAHTWNIIADELPIDDERPQEPVCDICKEPFNGEGEICNACVHEDLEVLEQIVFDTEKQDDIMSWSRNE